MCDVGQLIHLLKHHSLRESQRNISLFSYNSPHKIEHRKLLKLHTRIQNSHFLKTEEFKAVDWISTQYKWRFTQVRIRHR
jgi:hypothetical protein